MLKKNMINYTIVIFLVGGLIIGPALHLTNGQNNLKIAKIAESTAVPIMNLVMIWHQHQPSYQDPETQIYEQPWVFMHGINSYPYMADVLNDYPDINVSINLTPSLLKQLDDYVNGVAYDRRLELLAMDEEDMSYENKSVIMRYFFDINSQFRQNGTRYHELSEKRNLYPTLSEQVTAFTNQEFLDLKVLFLAHWINPRYTTLSANVVANITLENDIAGNHYSKTDKANLLSYAYSIIQDALLYHDSLQNEGRLEIMTTPFYHPILPLLVNLSSAQETDPGNANLPLPSGKTNWTDDALTQIQRGRNFTYDHFNEYPNGMWPSEMAVSPAIVPLVNESGISWFATDYTVLQKSLSVPSLTPEQWFKPYRVTEDNKSVAVFFRHQQLSDEVGFNYGGLVPDTAATNFVNTLQNILDNWNGTEDPVFTVALDGENAWENYQYDLDGDGDTEYTGNMFRESLYAKLEAAQDAGWLRTITPSQYLKEHPVSTLDEIPMKTGSWANDLTVWIGEDDENLGWDRLITARETLVAYETAHPTENLSDAWEALYAAEGSDWFWWYGSDRDSGHDELFDWAFKLNLRAVYKGINWTDQQILDTYPSLFLQLKPTIGGVFKGKELPIIDGQKLGTEWDLSAYYNDSGKVDDKIDFLGELYAAVDDDLNDIHFRIDLSPGFSLASLVGNSSVSIGLYFYDPKANNLVIFPRYANQSDSSEILGVELATELRIEFSDLSKIDIYKVNASKQWEKQVTTETNIATADFIEFTISLSTLNAVKGDTLLLSVVGTINDNNIDVMPQDGPWRLTIPIGGVTMTEIFSIDDPEGDERGIYPTNPQMHPEGDVNRQGFMDVLRFRVGYDAEWTIFEFKFKELENVWNSPVGYSHPLMQVYIDKDRIFGSGATVCDQNGHFSINSENAWEVLVRSDGFDRYILWENGTQTQGMESFSDAVDKIIVIKAPRSVVGIPTTNWAYTVVVGSQDFSAFREFYSQPQEWKFGGGDDSIYDPNVVDMLIPVGRDQDTILDSYSVLDMRFATLTAVGPGIGFEVDITDPIIEIVNPNDEASFTLEEGSTEYELIIQWSASDPVQGDLAGLDRIELYIDSVFIPGIAFNDTSFSASLVAGSHTIRINVFDQTGNYGSATVSITIEEPTVVTTTTTETTTSATSPGFELWGLVLFAILATLVRRKNKR
jgi:alpha-amylase/alpha-mannosidase (GH57 family)